jgi:hypothetical protein
MIKTYLMLLGVLFALFPTISHAQSNRCNVDLSTVAALIFQAQAGFSSGDDSTGLNRLSQAQTLITSIQASCDGGSPSTPTPESSEPTAETPLPTQPASTTETQVYQAPDGVFSVEFPAHWVWSDSERSILIGNSQSTLVALTLPNTPLQTGDRGATILINRPDVLVPNGETIEQVASFYRQLFGSELSVNVGEIQPLTIDDRSGLGFRYTAQGYSGFFLVVPLDEEEFLLMFAIAPLGDDVRLPAETIEIAKQVRLGVETSETAETAEATESAEPEATETSDEE